MDELTNKLQAKDGSKKQNTSNPKTSREYASLDLLLEELRSENANTQRSATYKSVLALIKSKVSFDVTGESIRAILEALKEFPEANLLYFLTVREREFGRTRNVLLDRLASKIVEESRSATAYPSEIHGPSQEPGNLTRILWWAKNTQGLLRDSESGGLEVTTARVALISLLPDKDQSFFIPAVLRIFERCIKQTRRKKPRSTPTPDSTTAFARLAADQLSTLKPKPSLKTLIEAAAVFHEANESLAAQLDRANRRWGDASNEITELGAEVTKLRQTCESRADEIKELQGKIKDAQSHIADQAERYEALEEYWKGQVSLQQNEMAFKIRTRLEHELNEIRLCLDRESPNKAMALDRVAKIYKLLAFRESV